MGIFTTLTPGAGWLKNLPALVADAQDGLTQADLTAAEAWADARVQGFFGRFYDTTTAAFRAAPIPREVANLLASARVIGFKFARGGGGDPGMVATLEAQARDLMQEARASLLLDASGVRITPLALAVPRVGEVSP